MRTKLAIPALLVVVALAALSAVLACGETGFDPASKVDSVRLFVVRADKPYARPGDTVTLEALITDQRKVKPREAKLYWIPILCLNPREDLYYLCFAPPGDGGRQAGGTRLVPVGAFADAGAAAVDAGGADAGGLSGPNPFASIPTGVDLAPFLPQGPSFTFRIPDDAVQARAGSDPYGLAIVFNVLCAGRIEFVARDPSGGAQQVPVRCAGEDGETLPPSDYVIGISRVYAWNERVNTNPVIEKVTFEEKDVGIAQGITLEKCTADREKDCKENKIGIRVSDSSWESNPAEVTREGVLREQIWVDYYSDIGKLESDSRLLFDAREGRISDSDVVFRAPKAPIDGTLWAVVHDNRGGAAWIVVPLHVR